MKLTSERIFRPLQLSPSNSPKSSTSNTKFSWILQHFKRPISEFTHRSIINKPITPICETQRGLRILIKQRRVISGTIHQRYLVFFLDMVVMPEKRKGSDRERESYQGAFIISSFSCSSFAVGRGSEEDRYREKQVRVRV
jgi:hypothetical protein